jgi:hypothetical protein
VARALPARQAVIDTSESLHAAWFAAMRRADFEAAWQVGDVLLARRGSEQRPWHLPRHEQWVWDGAPLAGRRVLVRCYHGLGDTLQFARFLPAVAELAQDLTVWAQPSLIPLLSTLSNVGRMRCLPLHTGTPAVDYDVDIEVMELAHALRARECDVGRYVPYFQVEPVARAGDRFSIGLVLASGGWNPTRSLTRELLDRLLQLCDLDVCNLQLEPPLAGARDLSSSDVLELARRVRALDLVITPDTMLAHLAGALAVPTWTLLPADADWRWHQPDRADSPWYPTMRLFRQTHAGNWRPVIDRVVAELARSRASSAFR